jgi:stage II sporulation protein D
MRRSAPAIALAALALAAPAASAQAAPRFVVNGAGFGHGIGMSQYGAFGYAQQGFSHDRILRSYYAGTTLGQAPTQPVRVLLGDGAASYLVRGAVRAGEVELDPAARYRVSASGVRDAGGEVVADVARVDAPAGGSLVFAGKRYRGGLEVVGRRAINVVGLEDYVRGVVARESPASWPIEALKAQAVAARTYAITTSKAKSLGFDHYPDQRSQVYDGVAAETPSTDRAVLQTRGQVVVRDGRPVVTYFFSTSGGHTENVENSFIGALAQPWLVGVPDPFDDASPRHRWRVAMTLGQAAAKLRGLYKGSFRGVRVVSRGVSPRVVRAQVLGSSGNGATTGPVLRARLGLPDTWANFSVLRSSKSREKPAPAAKGTTPTDQSAPQPAAQRSGATGGGTSAP